jgi:hypothetical protein
MSLHRIRGRESAVSALDEIRRERLRRRLTQVGRWSICMVVTAVLFYAAYAVYGPAGTLALLPLGAASGYLVGARFAAFVPVPAAISIAFAWALREPGMSNHVSVTAAIGMAAILALISVVAGLLIESLRTGKVVPVEAPAHLLRVAGLRR